MRLDRVAGLGRQRVHRQRHRPRVGRADHRQLGRPPRSGPPSPRTPTSTGSIASQGTPARVSCSSRCRTVCDLPEPVAPVHQRVPVQRRQRHPELADRPVLAVQDRAEVRRVGAGPASTGHVEVARLAAAAPRAPRGAAGRSARPARPPSRRTGTAQPSAASASLIAASASARSCAPSPAAQPVRVRGSGRPTRPAPGRAGSARSARPPRPAPGRSTGPPRGTRLARRAGLRPARHRTATAPRRTGAARSAGCAVRRSRRRSGRSARLPPASRTAGPSASSASTRTASAGPRPRPRRPRCPRPRRTRRRRTRSRRHPARPGRRPGPGRARP